MILCVLFLWNVRDKWDSTFCCNCNSCQNQEMLERTSKVIDFKTLIFRENQGPEVTKFLFQGYSVCYFLFSFQVRASLHAIIHAGFIFIITFDFFCFSQTKLFLNYACGIKRTLMTVTKTFCVFVILVIS